MDFPLEVRWKIGDYDVQITGAKMKARIVNREKLVERGISELKSALDKDSPIVGVDFQRLSRKTDFGHFISEPPPSQYSLLIMCVDYRFLIVQLHLLERFPKALGLFLNDESICFSGFRTDEHINELKSYLATVNGGLSSYDHCLTGNGAEILNLASAIFKNPTLQRCGTLSSLAKRVGFDRGMVKQWD